MVLRLLHVRMDGAIIALGIVSALCGGCRLAADAGSHWCRASVQAQDGTESRDQDRLLRWSDVRRTVYARKRELTLERQINTRISDATELILVGEKNGADIAIDELTFLVGDRIEEQESYRQFFRMVEESYDLCMAPLPDGFVIPMRCFEKRTTVVVHRDLSLQEQISAESFRCFEAATKEATIRASRLGDYDGLFLYLRRVLLDRRYNIELDWRSPTPTGSHSEQRR